MATFPGTSASGTAAPARSAIPAALASLKDVGGIAGSFVFTNDGQLFAREMHPMFDNAALSEAAERLTRLRDTFAAVGDNLELAVIRYQDHKLYLKVLQGGMLCILADGVVNMAAMRMAANLVGRRIVAELQGVAPQVSGPRRPSGAFNPVNAAAAPPPMFTRTPLPTPARTRVVVEPSTAPSTAMQVPGTRRFRGRTVE